MERNKALDIVAAQELDKLYRLLLDSHYAAPGDAASDKPPRTNLSVLEVGQALKRAQQGRKQGDVDDALDNGATYGRIAPVLELARGSSVHWTYGKRKDVGTVEESQEIRRARARERVARARQKAREENPPPEIMGVSALRAAEILGIDPRTVRSRAKKGTDPQIQPVTWTTANGKETTRFVITPAGASRG